MHMHVCVCGGGMCGGVWEGWGVGGRQHFPEKQKFSRQCVCMMCMCMCVWGGGEGLAFS